VSLEGDLMSERPRRGRTVGGTSAKKGRIILRRDRLDAQRLRESGISEPEETTAPEDLEELARRLREQDRR
jgi:hypothetical protein